jgi:hypothetical protein
MAGMAIAFSAGAAAATCPSPSQPCITRLEAKRKTPTFGGEFLLVVHWSSSCNFSHFHLRVDRSTYSPNKLSGQNRNQLCSQRSETILIGSAHRGSRVSASISGCVRYVIGKDRCTPFSTPVTIVLDTPEHATACRRYATLAVGAARNARFRYRCDRRIISGPRWSMSFQEHFDFCTKADPKVANAEHRARNAIMHDCRVKAAMPQGKPTISVSSRAGDTFFLRGRGFLPNTPVVIRVRGPGAAVSAITVANNQRIVSAADGSLSLTLFGAQVCKRGGGQVIFTAEDQDRPASNVASATCSP